MTSHPSRRHPSKHPSKIERFIAPLAVSLLALCLTSLAPAGVARHASAGIAKVTVTFTDTTLRVSAANPESGTTTFIVVNKGKKHHVLAITGPGLTGTRTAKLAGGSRATLTVKLRPGAYVLSDPVGLGVYNVQFLNVVRAAVVSSSGGSSVVNPPVELPPMCGGTYTP
jgi:hypothetical protein